MLSRMPGAARTLIEECVDGADRTGAAHGGRTAELCDRRDQIKRFAILDHDFTQETGELTPTMKVKRNVVYARYADNFEALHSR